MNLSFETIQPEDYHQVDQLVTAAFTPAQATAGTAPNLVHRLRSTYDYQPSLEVVAKPKVSQVVGHGLLSPVTVRGNRHTTTILALASLAVDPEWQGQAIGSQLLSELEARARLAGFAAISAVGDMNFFGSRGYVMAEDFSIHNSLAVPMGSHLIKPLTAGALARVGGMLEYPASFK
ncbi:MULTISPECIES: GNAT family N-acetyltransferase [Lactobacillaceae]|uniref:GNAT family N-acetyltransferase n=1 Tax=Lactobacillaceae TaxID=33958 RepID=UPI001457681D|nr:N-acetyltransferase [Lactobacillus sp. HBUAS51381]NLR10164.1 N-acetyltransferase [Lactobacillus sp. HBUAS51381]